MAQSSDARILDRGYRRYDGPRNPGWAPVVSLATSSIKRALGLRRSPASKILPVLTVVLAYLPAVAFVGLVALFPPEARDFAPRHQDYFFYVSAVIYLMGALVVPELLCPDRRSGMLGLYLTSPLTPLRYLGAKLAAAGALLTLVTVGPPLLLVVAYSLQGIRIHGAGELAVAAARILASGAVVAGLFGAVAMAISSLTDRRAFASAGIILAILVPRAVTAVLVESFRYERWIELVSLTRLPFEIVQRIHGQSGGLPAVPTWTLSVAWTGVVVSSLGVLVARYRR